MDRDVKRWVVAVAAMVALVLSSGGDAIADATSRVAPAADPIIDRTISEGRDWGVTVWRDPHGVVVAVMTAVSPYSTEPVWCRLVVVNSVDVDDEISWATAVQQHGTHGRAAVCRWIR